MKLHSSMLVAAAVVFGSFTAIGCSSNGPTAEAEGSEQQAQAQTQVQADATPQVATDATATDATNTQIATPVPPADQKEEQGAGAWSRLRVVGWLLALRHPGAPLHLGTWLLVAARVHGALRAPRRALRVRRLRPRPRLLLGSWLLALGPRRVRLELRPLGPRPRAGLRVARRGLGLRERRLGLAWRRLARGWRAQPRAARGQPRAAREQPRAGVQQPRGGADPQREHELELAHGGRHVEVDVDPLVDERLAHGLEQLEYELLAHGGLDPHGVDQPLERRVAQHLAQRVARQQRRPPPLS